MEKLERNIAPKKSPEKTNQDLSIERQKLSEDVLEKITNADFLRIQRNNRLENVTDPTIKSDTLKEGQNVQFSFRFNSKINSDLYLRTTAGQVFSEEVESIEFLGETWKRNGTMGEFFDGDGNRLIIRDKTQVRIAKIRNAQEIETEKELIAKKTSKFQGDKNYDLVVAGMERGLNPDITIKLFGEKIEGLASQDKGIKIEEYLTELERTKDYFSESFKLSPFQGDKNLSKEFLAYYINEESSVFGDDWAKETRKELGISDDVANKYSRREELKKYQGFRKMDELSPSELASLSDIPKEKVEGWTKESFGKQFVPGSKEAQQLFAYAAIVSGLPKDWGTNEGLHYILGRESNGIVGRANYTMVSEGISGQNLKEKALQNNNLAGNKIARVVDVISTATGLGQLTLSNEKYLPNGRASIGIPLEEAIGMLRYIHDRYGSIAIAREMYGTTGYYTHAISGNRMVKSFSEGY